jgi:anthranilate phosphoribosyltransferase
MDFYSNDNRDKKMNGIKKYIEKVVNSENLSEEEAVRAFQIIMNGGATPSEMGAFLVGLRMKGETIEEITGAATVMRAKSEKIIAPQGAIDTCGTGGDASGSFNISTAVAFVVAACGVPVAKHGNKAVSSLSGSSDVLKELGVNVDADKNIIQKCLDEAGICFMPAPKFHMAMRHVAPIRKELGIRTIFNVLGPLSSPAEAKFQLLGVYSKALVEPLAHVLGKLGVEKAWVVHGSDGLDELTITGKSYVAELDGGNLRTFEINPQDFDIEIVPPEDLEGGDVNRNAQEMKAVLNKRGSKAYRDIVLLNAAACLVVVGKAADLKSGIAMAAEAIDSGKANEKLMELVAVSNEYVAKMGD